MNPIFTLKQCGTTPQDVYMYVCKCQTHTHIPFLNIRLSFALAPPPCLVVVSLVICFIAQQALNSLHLFLQSSLDCTAAQGAEWIIANGAAEYSTYVRVV